MSYTKENLRKMISVFQNPNITKKVIEELADHFYSTILSSITNDEIGKSIEKKLNGISSSFKLLIKTPLEGLLNIEKKFGMVSKEEAIYLTSLYEKIRNKNGAELIKKLEINTCLYCNIYPILTYKDDKRTIAEATFDHFYPKALHPLLSICVYNLIPICNACNQAKSIKQITYSPYNEKYGTDHLLTFSYNLVSSEKIVVNLNILNDLFIKNVSTLKLYNRYNSDTILKEVKKIENIVKYAAKNHTVEDLKNYLDYCNEEDYGKNTLSKLKHDITNELLEIKFHE